MDQKIEINKRRGTRVLLSVLAVWGLGVVVAAEPGSIVSFTRCCLLP